MTRRVVLTLVALLVAGCGNSREEAWAAYCESVEAHQEKLSETMAEESPTTLLRALPVFRELAEDAPRDIEDDWARVNDALTGLDDALDEAGVDPATYDATNPPPDVSAQQRRAIAAAADEVARPEVAASLEGVQQHARDVCRTPLYR